MRQIFPPQPWNLDGFECHKRPGNEACRTERIILDVSWLYTSWLAILSVILSVVQRISNYECKLVLNAVFVVAVLSRTRWQTRKKEFLRLDLASSWSSSNKSGWHSEMIEPSHQVIRPWSFLKENVRLGSWDFEGMLAYVSYNYRLLVSMDLLHTSPVYQILLLVIYPGLSMHAPSGLA